MTVKLEGQLEVDVNRGVIYFHNNKNGCSTLRICSIYIPENFDGNAQIDITCDGNTKIMHTRLDGETPRAPRSAMPQWVRRATPKKVTACAPSKPSKRKSGV